MKEIISQRIQSLTPEYKEFIMGDYISKIVTVFAAAESLSEEQTEYLRLSVLLFTLFFATKDELIVAVATNLEISKNNAGVLVEAILQAFPEEFILAQGALLDFFEADIFTDKRLEKIAQTHTIEEPRQQLALVEVVASVTSGAQTQGAIPQLLIERLGLTQSDAMRLTADVLDFLAPLSDSGVAVATRIPINQTATAAESASPETVVASEQNPPPTPESVDSLAAEIAATEASFHQLQPIRTMASDMNSLRSTEEPVHQGVSQNTLLNGDGNGKKNPDARWGNG